MHRAAVRCFLCRLMDTEKLIQWLKTKWYYVLPVLVAVPTACFMLMMSVRGNNTDFAATGSRLIIVKEGMTTADIAQLLHEKQLVKDPAAFRLEARFKGLAHKLQAGPYQIKGGLSNGQIVDVMAKGRIKQLRFTVPEGYTIAKIGKKLEAEGLGSAAKFCAAAKNYAPYDYMKTDNSNVIYKAEGFAFPATYDFPVGVGEDKLLAMMVHQFDVELKEAGLDKAAAEQKMSIRDLVNMAAMVELEAVFPEEQPRIAGVFLKRLAIGMPIQSDTTIQYILGEQKEIITFADTEIQNPYNTYQNPGMPPGPIGSPGLSALKAVLQPEQTDYLYFVAEKDGHHRFTRTYTEHLQAIKDIG